MRLSTLISERKSDKKRVKAQKVSREGLGRGIKRRGVSKSAASAQYY